MEKVLTQEEIDALFRVSWGQIGAGAGVSENAVTMERWNLHKAGQVRKVAKR